MGRPQDGDGCGADTEQERQDAAEDPGSTLVERSAAIVSALLVATMIGLVLYQAITATGTRHPDLVASVEQVLPQVGGFHVAYRIENRGGATAAAVRVEGTLSRGEAVVDAAEAEIDYVAAHSSHRGGLIFRDDPAGYDLRLRVTGYRRP